MTDSAGGPKTEAGKEVARWNATRHGIRSPAPVVPGIEKKEDWEEHRDGVLENLSPVGHLEGVLAERAALMSWRLHRVTRYETESIVLYQERAEEDLASKWKHDRRDNDLPGTDHPEDVRWRLKDAQRTHRILKKLSGFPEDKSLSGDDAAGVLRAVSEWIEEADLKQVELPSGVPDWARVGLEEEWWDGWTAGLVREYVGAMASSAGETPDELLEAATEKVGQDVIRAKQGVERLEQDLARMSRERLLPEEKTLEKITRYEAHLSRQLYQALHELEALQTKRGGGAAPLARFDVQGLET
jgi:hypothetical protein